MVRNFARIALFFGLVVGALGASGCSSEAAPESEESASGTLSMPLLASAGEHTYRLQGAMYVNGPTFTYLDLNADSDVISTTLPTGNYGSYLYWWNLTRDDGTGNFKPVQAELLSTNQPSFSIFNQTTSTISFDFETDGQLVTVGSGALRVAVDVSERPAICTPLGSDCAEGTWCAPSELTGAPLSCIAAGKVAVGEACASPFDCVANTSCFDFGAGPSCTPLCSSAEFGLECADGGVCTAQGADYGVCISSP